MLPAFNEYRSWILLNTLQEVPFNKEPFTLKCQGCLKLRNSAAWYRVTTPSTPLCCIPALLGVVHLDLLPSHLALS